MRGSTRPRCRLVATRLDRMPPSAPAELTNAGCSTSSAGRAAKMANCFCTATPARVDSTTAADRTGSDSQMMVRSSASRARNDTTNTAMLSATMVQARVVVTEPRPSSLVARNSAGMVMTSPSVDTVGATRLSMSQPRRTAPSDSSTVAARTTRLASTPPTTEMRARSSTPIALSTPKPTEITLGHHGQEQRQHERERQGGQHVLAQHRLPAERHAERAGVDGGGDPVPEGAEDVAPQPDGGGHHHQQARQVLERAGEGSQHRARHQAGAGVEEQGDQALARRVARSDPRRSTRRRPRSRGRGIQEGSRRAIVAECLCTGSGRPRAAGRTGSP